MIFVYKPLNADARTLEILKNVIVPTTLINFYNFLISGTKKYFLQNIVILQYKLVKLRFKYWPTIIIKLFIDMTFL